MHAVYVFVFYLLFYFQYLYFIVDILCIITDGIQVVNSEFDLPDA